MQEIPALQANTSLVAHEPTPYTGACRPPSSVACRRWSLVDCCMSLELPPALFKVTFYTMCFFVYHRASAFLWRWAGRFRCLPHGILGLVITMCGVGGRATWGEEYLFRKINKLLEVDMERRSFRLVAGEHTRTSGNPSSSWGWDDESCKTGFTTPGDLSVAELA